MKRLTGFVDFNRPAESQDEVRYGLDVDFDKDSEEHNTLTSLTSFEPDEPHLPVIDIDFPIAAVPSSTPGHFHLYIEKPTTFEAFESLLYAMVEAGWVEEGYYRAFQRRNYTVVRKPGVLK